MFYVYLERHLYDITTSVYSDTSLYLSLYTRYSQWLDSIPCTGLHRMRNYLYVISIYSCRQIIQPKLFGLSHEYGMDCIRGLETWSDVR